MCRLNQEKIDKQRSSLLKTLQDILYLKHKALPLPNVELPDYFNIQTSETTLTINATKGGIDQFLKQYGHLKTPPKSIDLLPFQDENRIWGSKWIVPAWQPLSDDVCPYQAETFDTSYFASDCYTLAPSLTIRFIADASDPIIFYATAPKLEGSYQELEVSPLDFGRVGYFEDICDINKVNPVPAYWILRHTFRLISKKEKIYSVSELRQYLSKYEIDQDEVKDWQPQDPLEKISDGQLDAALKAIYSIGDVEHFNKVYHPELVLNQKGWEQFIQLLKLLRDKKEWFLVTYLNRPSET